MYFDLKDKAYPYSFYPGAVYQSLAMKLKKEERFHVLWYITSPTDGTFPGANKDGTPRHGRIERVFSALTLGRHASLTILAPKKASRSVSSVSKAVILDRPYF